MRTLPPPPPPPPNQDVVDSLHRDLQPDDDEDDGESGGRGPESHAQEALVQQAKAVVQKVLGYAATAATQVVNRQHTRRLLQRLAGDDSTTEESLANPVLEVLPGSGIKVGGHEWVGGFRCAAVPRAAWVLDWGTGRHHVSACRAG